MGYCYTYSWVVVKAAQWLVKRKMGKRFIEVQLGIAQNLRSPTSPQILLRCIRNDVFFKIIKWSGPILKMLFAFSVSLTGTEKKAGGGGSKTKQSIHGQIQIFEFISCARPCYRLWCSKERTKTKKLVLMETVPGLKDLHEVKNKHSLTRDEFTRLTIEFSNTEQPRVPGYSSTLTVFSIMVKVDPSVRGKTYLAVFPYHKRHSFLKFLLACLPRNTHWVTLCKSQHPNLLPSVK